jgi:hypothetical protein
MKGLRKVIGFHYTDQMRVTSKRSFYTSEVRKMAENKHGYSPSSSEVLIVEVHALFTLTFNVLAAAATRSHMLSPSSNIDKYLLR